jgi:hypothetical protein
MGVGEGTAEQRGNSGKMLCFSELASETTPLYPLLRKVEETQHSLKMKYTKMTPRGFSSD